MKVIFQNKGVIHGYDLLDKLEVGIVLTGWEVKSAKAGKMDVRGAFVEVSPTGELFLQGARIPAWDTAPAVDPQIQNRRRKLLATKKESLKLGGLASRPGYTLVPMEGYVNDRGLVKIVIALVKGKKKFEKKQRIKERDMQRQIQKDIKRY